MSRLTAVSLFAGCGGFCDGIELAGFKIKCAVEFDRFAAATYRHNFPKNPLFEGDIARFLNTPGDDHIAKYGLKDLDLVFGGPPCQGYSQIGPRDLKDPRNHLFEEFSRVVETLKPKLFLMENVPNLLLLNKGHFRDLILEEFARIGYSNTTYLKVSAADYGVPQLRQRVVFVGIRDDLDVEFAVPSPSLYKDADVRVGHRLTSPPIPTDAPNNELTKQSPTVVERLGHILPGQNAFTAAM